MWPNDTRFSHENFGYQPISLIMSALENGRKIYYQEHHDSSLAIAKLTHLTGITRQIKIEGRDMTVQDCLPFSQILEAMEAKTFQKDACAVVRSYHQDKGLYPWIYRLLPMEKLLAEDDPKHPVPSPRIWANGIARIALIAPRIVGNKVQCIIAAMEEGIHDQQIPIYDLDTSRKICNIQVYGDGGQCYRTAADSDGVEFEIVGIKNYD